MARLVSIRTKQVKLIDQSYVTERQELLVALEGERAEYWLIRKVRGDQVLKVNAGKKSYIWGLWSI